MRNNLLDTNILIRYLRQSPGYLDLLQRLDIVGEIHISAITRLEIVRGMRDHERQRTFDLFDSFQTISVNSEIADLAGDLIRTWRARGVILGDADTLIAASAFHNDLTLVTTNARHFPMSELTILQADENGVLTPRT